MSRGSTTKSEFIRTVRATAIFRARQMSKSHEGIGTIKKMMAARR